MILFRGNTKHIPLYIKLPVLLIILWITVAPDIINYALNYNLGIPMIRFQKFYFVVIPFSFVFKNSFLKSRKKYPFLVIYFFTLIVFVLIELYNTNMPEFDLFTRWLWIYLLFFILVNLTIHITNISFIIEYFTISILINTIILILVAYNIISFPLNYSDDAARLMGEFNLNRFADMNAFAISILITTLFIPQFISYIKKRNLIIVLIILSTLPLLTGTRGSVFIILFALTFYLLYNYLRKSIYQQLLISVLIFVAFLIIGDLFRNYINQVLIVKRFQELNIYSQGRGYQIFASWENFVNNPWFGVGYKYAAAGIISGITRSNFQYTQILASSGIFFFILYMYFLFRIFTNNLYSIKYPPIIIILSIVLIQFVFRRPDYPLAFLMFISYRYSIYLENKT